MKRWRLGVYLLAIVALLCLICPSAALADTEDGGARVIVCFKGDGVSTQSRSWDDLVWEPLMDVTTVDTLALEGATAKEKDLSVQTYGLSGESKTLMLVTSDSLSNDALITQLEAREDVLFAEAD